MSQHKNCVHFAWQLQQLTFPYFFTVDVYQNHIPFSVLYDLIHNLHVLLFPKNTIKN
jgi:hypothetical protein